MRILFDQGTPVPLRREFSDHQVATAQEMGWSNLSNGELLQESEKSFDLLITTDQNLRYQQNLSGRSVAVLVLTTTSWPRIQRFAKEVVVTALAMNPGDYREFVVAE
jgi:predicted nuclease of predicted toxin-antitoxin system